MFPTYFSRFADLIPSLENQHGNPKKSKIKNEHHLPTNLHFWIPCAKFSGVHNIDLREQTTVDIDIPPKKANKKEALSLEIVHQIDHLHPQILRSNHHHLRAERSWWICNFFVPFVSLGYFSTRWSNMNYPQPKIIASFLCLFGVAESLHRQGRPWQSHCRPFSIRGWPNCTLTTRTFSVSFGMGPLKNTILESSMKRLFLRTEKHDESIKTSWTCRLMFL